MINHDTIELLKQCNAGLKMGVCSIDEVLDKVSDEKFKQILIESKEEHQALGSESHKYLDECGEEGKEPNIVAKGMSWMKINMVIAMEDSDKKIASVITDGCDMGIKSLSRYLNQYESASEEAKDLAKRIINLEERLRQHVQDYL